jgi:hypothetical protein
VFVTGAALVLVTGEKMHADWSRRPEAFQGLEAVSQVRGCGNSLQEIATRPEREAMRIMLMSR